jgi:cell shape-determining protein MreD
MNFFLNALVSLCLLLFQTTIINYISFLERCFDILIVYIIFLGFYRNFFEGLCFTFLSGVVMDSLGGGPFGVYLTTYFWLFIFSRKIKYFLHTGSLLLLPVFIASGVLFENIIFLAFLVLHLPWPDIFSAFFESLPEQFLWAFFSGPVMFYFIRYLYAQWDRYLYKMAGAENKNTS